jgi:hypothetical protein
MVRTDRGLPKDRQPGQKPAELPDKSPPSARPIVVGLSHQRSVTAVQKKEFVAIANTDRRKETRNVAGEGAMPKRSKGRNAILAIVGGV